MRILICDDDPIVHESLNIYLEKEGYETVSAFNGLEALQMTKNVNPDFIVLDVMMPKISGMEVCKEIRKFSTIPILMLTARGEEIDRILGLEIGADDYIVKPFSPREVVARIKAISRRMSDNQTLEGVEVIILNHLEISLKKYEVNYKGETIISTPREVEILHLLASQKGKVLSRELILKELWGFDYYGDSRTVDTHIRRIRSKLPKDVITIHSIYGVGYKLEG